MPDTPGDALVTATFSQRMRLRLPEGRHVTGRLKGKKIRPVCGDRVRVDPIDGEPEWLIQEVLPRVNELSRPDRRGRKEVLAANLTSLAVVMADAPAADWFMVDRYLAAAELISVAAVPVFNKIDVAEPSPESAAELRQYSDSGYSIVRCSAKTRVGLDELERLLCNQTSIIVGQSGVGKSSLINALIQDAEQQTAAISRATGEGRHTTANSVMLALPSGGGVIDSPGVRDYAPAIDGVDAVAAGFREICAQAAECRFANCRHLREPQCAVKAAVEDGSISARRYESYRRLLNLTEKLVEQRSR